jgi:hypothetical protein
MRMAGGSSPVHAGRLAEALDGADDGGEDIDPPRIGATPGEAGSEWCMLR